MIKISRNHAEERFAATRKKQKAVLSEEQEKVLKQRENTARLKALRLEKEAADAKDAADKKPALARKKRTK
ncbi:MULTISPECIES: hypothetical protein [Cohaesibacter]|uniref:hypothetical protein n=1 Tax=Cohaesibacter TaxID=655352 RepID=UPI000DE982AE|nr:MULTISPECIES: hypothetical protein [Cohaesibacter]TLP48133.1 hypothetical protein FDK21_00210 [Cohaesibacter sp. CAU 1516]